MGKKNKDKKKGKGAEKTAAKTEKKLATKMKKELQALGEDDIETIVAQIEKEEKKRLQVTEARVDPPSRRVNFTFIAHPDKEQLILYGGELFDGQKTFVYNDLFFYNISNGTWTVVKAPAGPPSRCGHQMVATSANKGQLWVFGGEFASPSQTQFYHYRDLWVYHLHKKQWEKITAPNGPSARSGHRMVYMQKQLIVFGGFHDNLKDYKYFNDVYSFNTETYKWTKLEPVGTPPAQRSGCCMVALNDGRVLVYGGYSKERIKKDVDKGHLHMDAFVLTPDKTDTTGLKYKWVQCKIRGISFPPRCSMPMVVAPNNKLAYCFGGVYDMVQDEENLAGTFYNDLWSIDLEKFVWNTVDIAGPKTKTKRRKEKNEDNDGSDEEGMEVEQISENAKITTIADDGIFTVTIGPALTPSASSGPSSEDKKIFGPSFRSNCGLAIKHGILYLYGGMYEQGNKQMTYKDFYSLDLKKLDEWKTIIEDDISSLEWYGSDSESGGEESSSEDDSDSDSEMDTD